MLPSEVAALAVYMVSDLANMVVGDTFYITGGSGVISYTILDVLHGIARVAFTDKTAARELRTILEDAEIIVFEGWG